MRRWLSCCVVVFFSCPRGNEGVGQGTFALMELDKELSGRRTFFDYPWPSDLRMRSDGSPDTEGWPVVSGNERIAAFKTAARGKHGIPVVPVGYFRFNAALKARDVPEVLAASKDSGLLLVELEPTPRLLPLVVSTPKPDPYTPENLLAVAPRPGVVLVPGRKHAYVVLRALGDAAGARLGISPALGEPLSTKLKDHFAPLFPALEMLAVKREDIAAATVFTPGDEVKALFELSEKVRAAHKPDVELLGVELDARFDTAPFCHLRGRIQFPQFQKGTPTFGTEGLFDAAAGDGLPPKQRDEVAPVSFSIPRREMPAAGYPLVLYFHGSGGFARQFIDGEESDPDVSEWAGTQLGARGFAVAGQAMPVSPDRVPGAQDIAYLNLANPVALRDTFRQGVLESRMFLDAIERLRIPAATLAACTGATLPAGATEYRFDLSRLSAQGQSMGGMYTNLVGAVEPRIKAAVPTGAGGYWTYFALITPQIPLPEDILGTLLDTSVKPLTFMHPGFALIQLVWEPVDPMLSTPRLSRRPLSGHPVRPVYEPVSEADSYFPTAIYDAMVLAYGNPLAGEEVWVGARAGLSSVGLPTSATYPVKQNLMSDDGTPYTGVAVQHSNDGGFDGHGIYRRVPSVMWQYGCFHETFRDTGVAVVPPPSPTSGACPR